MLFSPCEFPVTRVPSFLPIHTLTKSPTVETVILCVPSGSALPLHDHPGMLVLAKLIFGRLRRQLVSVLPKPKGTEVRVGLYGRSPSVESHIPAVFEDKSPFWYSSG
eukprot:GHVU01084931.1.p2 GENE.GHVU01084931.1~~GHVU01084931.1.p2  ORF type:complete len:107 (-),score=0.70 GHVU01084931.1:241-561(-)